MRGPPPKEIATTTAHPHIYRSPINIQNVLTWSTQFKYSLGVKSSKILSGYRTDMPPHDFISPRCKLRDGVTCPPSLPSGYTGRGTDFGTQIGKSTIFNVDACPASAKLWNLQVFRAPAAWEVYLKMSSPSSLTRPMPVFIILALHVRAACGSPKQSAYMLLLRINISSCSSSSYAL